MVIRGEAKAKTLEQIYDVCNRLFKDKDCFYTAEELEQEKANKNNVFLQRRNSNERIFIDGCCDSNRGGVFCRNSGDFYEVADTAVAKAQWGA